jgi:PAS domain S-box-containing protein
MVAVAPGLRTFGEFVSYIDNGNRRVKGEQKSQARSALAPRYGLRGRLILLVFIAIVPALFLILYNAKRDRDVSAARIEEDAQRIVKIAAARQARFIDSARQLLNILAEVPDVRPGNQASCNRFMKNLVERHSVFANLGVLDRKGNLVCSAVPFSGAVNLSDRAYFRRAEGSKAFAIGNYQIGRVTGRGTINFGYPVLDPSGEVGAVVFAALDLSWLTQLTGDVRLPMGASLSILDSQGTIVARFPEPGKWVGRPVPDAPLFQILQLRDQETKELMGVDGVRRLYAFSTLSGKAEAGQLYVIVGIRKEIAFAELDRRLQTNLAWLGVACLLALATSWFIGNRYVVDYVNERARAEDARLRLAAIVESSEDAIVGKSLDGTIISWNNGAELMYGYTAAEAIGRPISILNSPDHPDENSRLLEIVKQGKGLNRFETERIRSDGRQVYVSASVSPIRDHEGKVVGLSTIARDITALRKVEERLRAHASQAETLYTLGKEIGGTLALDEVIQRALDRAVSASGFEAALIHFAESAGPAVYRAARPSRSSAGQSGLLARIEADFERKVLACSEPWLVEDTAAVPDLKELQRNGGIGALAVFPLSGGEQFRGALTLLSSRAHAFDFEESQFLHALAQQIALAITNAHLYGATVNMNAHLQEEVEERKRAEKMLADFTAMVVHDLRSPLSNLISIAESLQDGMFGPINEEQSKWLWKMESNCRSLIEHVSDFLDLSKIEAGRIELLKKPTDVAALIHDNLVEYSIQADKRNIRLKDRIDNPLPPVVVDARRFNQVLSNLLSNALKFSRDGDAIEVGARCATRNEVIVWIKDTGVGIPRDEIHQIFEKYRQVSSARNSGHKGTGLGLVICKKITEAHGGRIWMESEEGKGTTVFFSIPVNARLPGQAEADGSK